LPINAKDDSLFTAVHDGLLICKLINDAIPETIDERVLNKGTNLNNFKIHENQAVAINSSKAIGCNVVNIGAQDLMDGAVCTPHQQHVASLLLLLGGVCYYFRSLWLANKQPTTLACVRWCVT
jgi:hypothetical protein